MINEATGVWLRRVHLGIGIAAVLVAAGARGAEPTPTFFAPSAWDLPLGKHAIELPNDAFIDFACGTNGGPPALPLAGWADFNRCAPEAQSGLREIYFRYDDEAEYWARAHDFQHQVAVYQYTAAYSIPVIVSALFDDRGFLRGIRIVSDPRVGDDLREKGATLGNFLTARYGEEGWACTDLPRLEGEQVYLGYYRKRQCLKADAAARSNLVIETRNYRKPGQQAIDPVTRAPTRGQFESSTRFEIILDASVADSVAGLAAVPAAGPSAKELWVQRAHDCPGCDLHGADLKRADLTGANLAGANLAGANLHGAILAGADLSGADLAGANINRADLKRANLRDATLRGAMVYESRFDAAVLSGADLGDWFAGRVQMIGANLSGANLTHADIRGARLTDANFRGANLSDSLLQDSQMSRADLDGATLAGAVLWRVNLQNASLAGANLTGADLFAANLRGANLTSADFTNAALDGANLYEATIAGAVWRNAELPADFDPNRATPR